MNSTLRTEINSYLISPFLTNISNNNTNKTLKGNLIQELNTIVQNLKSPAPVVNATPVLNSPQNVSLQPTQQRPQTVIARPLNKKSGSKKIIDSLINAHEIAQELAIKTKSKKGEPNTPEHNFFNDMDNELLKFTYL